MPFYQYGNWKKSALITLERLKEKNDVGIRPKAADFKNGAISAWLSIFKQPEHGEVANGKGYQITSKGIALLTELKNFKFASPRGSRDVRLANSAAPVAIMKTPVTPFFIDIKGPNGLHIASPTTVAIANKIIKTLTGVN